MNPSRASAFRSKRDIAAERVPQFSDIEDGNINGGGIAGDFLLLHDGLSGRGKLTSSLH
jgi:hypothetical protein